MNMQKVEDIKDTALKFSLFGIVYPVNKSQ